MNFKLLFQISIISIAFAACIGDDIIDDIREPEIRIISTLDSIEINTTFMLNAMYLNKAGIEEQVNVLWMSSDESIASIDNNGLLNALGFGEATISVIYMEGDISVSDSLVVVVGMSTTQSTISISGTINTTSSYKLTGSFNLSENEQGNGIELTFNSDYCASTSLPGLYVYLSNNKNNIGNALEIGEVEVFYFCKPFNVKVGDGEL